MFYPLASFPRRLSPSRRPGSVWSTVLFARPSFWSGFLKLLDPMRVSQDYNRSRTVEEADVLAIQADWRAIGGDMHDALRTVRHADHADADKPAAVSRRHHSYA